MRPAAGALRHAGLPVPTDRLIHYERLAAPRGDGEILVDPPAPALARLARDAAAAPPDAPLLDTSLAALRRALRASLGLAGPLVVTGHQPEFFHAGVFAKNIAAGQLAAQLGGSAAFLVVDNDVPKSAYLPLPRSAGRGLRLVDVPIPGADLKLTFADQPPQPRDRWLSFFAQIGALQDAFNSSLLGRFARSWIEHGRAAACEYVGCFEAARASAERELGMEPLRGVRMSALAGSTAMRAFVAHVALRAREFADCYNAAQSDYRVRHKVKTDGRPVPRLHADGERVELPFWIMEPGRPRRRLHVSERGGELEWLAEGVSAFTLPRSALERAADLPPWPGAWHVWPRALALSAFARLLLADLFIHGIGGAKYDEMTDQLVPAFFGTPAAPLCCVTATLRLPLARPPGDPGDLLAAQRNVRDLRWNPQRHVIAAPADQRERRMALARRSDLLRRDYPEKRGERRAVYLEIRRLNELLLAHDPWLGARYEQRVEALDAAMDEWEVADSREYFFALHSRTALAALRERIGRALEGV